MACSWLVSLASPRLPLQRTFSCGCGGHGSRVTAAMRKQLALFSRRQHISRCLVKEKKNVENLASFRPTEGIGCAVHLFVCTRNLHPLRDFEHRAVQLVRRERGCRRPSGSHGNRVGLAPSPSSLSAKAAGGSHGLPATNKGFFRLTKEVRLRPERLYDNKKGGTGVPRDEQ